MRIQSLALAVTMLAASLAVDGANAKTLSVPSGKTVKIGSYAILMDNTCAYGKISKVTTSQPKNGTLKTANERVEATSVGPCRGVKIPGITVYYTSKPGFHGRDCGKVVFFHPILESDAQNFGHPFPVCVNVK